MIFMCGMNDKNDQGKHRIVYRIIDKNWNMKKNQQSTRSTLILYSPPGAVDMISVHPLMSIHLCFSVHMVYFHPWLSLHTPMIHNKK